MEVLIPDKAASCAALRLRELYLNSPSPSRMKQRMEQRIFNVDTSQRLDWI
jgi:hypothetical protein